MRSVVKVRRVDGHLCDLPREEELITLYINGGLFVNFRRKFRSYMMVDASNPESKSFLKSTAQIRSEESRHLRRFYYMMHPFSQARFKWETIMIVVYIGLFILCPLEISLVNTLDVLLYTKFLLDIMSFIDICLFFVTGYFDENLRIVVMKPWTVSKRYIMTYFFVDLVSSMPYNMFIYFTENYQIHEIKYFFVLKVFRAQTLVNYMRKFLLRTHTWTNKIRTVGFTVYLGIMFWGITNLGIAILVSKQQRTTQKVSQLLVNGFHETIRQLMLVEISHIENDGIMTILFNMSCLCLGFILNMILVAQLMRIYQRQMKSRNKYNYLMRELGEYMHFKSLPQLLRVKIEHFMDFKFQKNVYKEHDLTDTLSSVLQRDVLIHNCRSLVESVDFFKELPQDIISHLIIKLRTEIYLPSDIIVQAGSPGSSMYFISKGTVAVYTSANTEICHLEDGNHFGEISLVLEEPRVASVVAVTNCELFRLNRKDFMEVIEPHPKFFNKVKQLALSRLMKTQQVMETEDF